MIPNEISATMGRDQLAELLREYLLCGHLIDRAGMPHIIARFGREKMGEIANSEWMGASPIYTRRIRSVLGIEDETVEAMFKAMQFDIGAPPEFLDFRFEVFDDYHGEFHLDYCGALMDVEPMGEDYVHTMCHAIEDPTFDATALATNRRARIRPVHRPPRVPADRTPHCRWTATIDPDAVPLADPAELLRTQPSALANLAFDLQPGVAPGDPGPGAADSGTADYRSPLQSEVPLAGLSSDTQHAVRREFSIQWHLLAMAGMCAIEAADASSEGRRAAKEIGARQLWGIAGLTTERLRRAFDLGTDLDSLAYVLQIHPQFSLAGYCELTMELATSELRVGLVASPALEPSEPPNWVALMADWPLAETPLRTVADATSPTMRTVAVSPRPGEGAAWLVTDGGAVRPEADEVAVCRFSNGADFRFRRDQAVRIARK